MRILRFLSIWLTCALGFAAQAQVAEPTAADQGIVEVSGIVIVKSQTNRKDPVPFATVSIKGSNRGTYANFQGMFSIVMKKGETLLFSAVGYEQQQVTIPTETDGNRKTLVVELAQTEIQIDEIVVFPWPDRDNLRAEFLAMNPTDAMQWEDLAQRNLSEQRMLAVAESLNMDGSENGDYYLKMQAKDFSAIGQVPAMPVFDPLAWAKLFKSWKEKKKEKDKED